MSFEITEEQQDLGPAPGPLASEGFLIRGSFDKTCWFLEQAITGRLAIERARRRSNRSKSSCVVSRGATRSRVRC